MFSNPTTSPPLTEALTSPGQKPAKSKLLRLLSHGQKLEEEEEEEGKKERRSMLREAFFHNNFFWHP
jgi:hypothetical protein